MKTNVFKRASYFAAALILAASGSIFVPGVVYADGCGEIEENGVKTVCTSDGLAAALSSAGTTAEVKLGADITASSAMVIARAVVLNGDGYTLTSSATDGIQTQTEDSIVIKNLRISGADRAVGIWTTDTSGKSFNVTLDGVTATVGHRGVTVNSTANTGAQLVVKNSTLQTAGLSNYDQEMPVADARGVSLWQMKNSHVIIDNSTLQGFSYVVNVAGGSSIDSTGTVVDITNSVLKGRDGLNQWSTNMTVNISNTVIHGVNGYPGPTEVFADIVLNTGTEGVKLNINDVTFTTYRNVATDTNKQYMIANRAYKASNPNVIKIGGSTTFVDSTKEQQDLGSVFEPTCNYGEVYGLLTCPDVEISGGTYDYGDVQYFVAEGKAAYKTGGDGPWVIDDETDVDVTPIYVQAGKTAELELTDVAKRYATWNIVTESGDGDPSEIATVEGTTITGVAAGYVEMQVILHDEDDEGRMFRVPVYVYDVNSDNDETVDEIAVVPTVDEMDESVVDPGELVSITGAKKNTEDKIAGYFDIDVLLYRNNRYVDNLTELGAPIKITLDIPTDLEDLTDGYTRNFYVIRMHNGVPAVLDVVNNGDGTVSFYSDAFSTYALAYVDTEVIVEETVISEGVTLASATEDVVNPNTLDDGMNYIVLASVAALTLVGAVIYLKKSEA